LHFALHHHRPRSRLARLLHQLHMRHHFEDERRGFGVSAPWWDVAFGTYSTRARRAQRDSGSAGSHLRS
jgi:dihydroceramide fatty acyl 2-hydroxylase